MQNIYVKNFISVSYTQTEIDNKLVANIAYVAFL